MAMMNGNEPLLSVVLELSWHYFHDFEIFLISLPICMIQKKKNQFSSLHIVRYNFSIGGKASKFYDVKFQSFASNRKVVSDNMQARKLVF